MAAPDPIQGVTSLKAGSVTTFTDATPAGTWSSTNTAVATIVAGTGIATALAQGTTQIVYTVGSDSTAINVTVTPVSSLTNGFDFDVVYTGYLKNRVLWQSQGLISDSQTYFEDAHPLCDTNILDSMRPDDGSDLTTYLGNKQRAVIMDMLNGVYNAPQIIDSSKLCFFRGDWMLVPQPVLNTGQFVGLKILMAKGDHAIKINSMELFFNQDVTFTMYLYNDMTWTPVYSKEVTANAGEQTIIDLSNDVVLNYLTTRRNKGGIWYFGYYQNDLGGAQANYYSIANETYHPIQVWSYSAPLLTDPQNNRNFQRNNIGSNNLTYGLNMEISTFVDATNNICQNSNLFDKLIGLMMAVRVVKDMIFSYRSGSEQRNIQGNQELSKLYAELNGYKADDEIPYVLGLQDEVNREMKRVKKSFQNYQTLVVGIS